MQNCNALHLKTTFTNTGFDWCVLVLLTNTRIVVLYLTNRVIKFNKTLLLKLARGFCTYEFSHTFLSIGYYCIFNLFLFFLLLVVLFSIFNWCQVLEFEIKSTLFKFLPAIARWLNLVSCGSVKKYMPLKCTWCKIFLKKQSLWKRLKYSQISNIVKYKLLKKIRNKTVSILIFEYIIK